MYKTHKYKILILLSLTFLFIFSACGAKQVKKGRGFQIANSAHKYLGVPYVYGGKSPKGFDCSGLVLHVYKENGVKMPAGSWRQATVGKKVSKSELRPGDLIFFRPSKFARINHVGIYIGNSTMIHAPGRGRKIEKGSIENSYFKKAYVLSRRVVFD